MDGATVHPREVMKCVVANRAQAVMLVHNHPSGSSEPSLADRQVTARMKAALAFIDVKVVDHLIVGETSLRKWRSSSSGPGQSEPGSDAGLSD